MMKVAPEIIRLIKENKKFLILSHVNPEGDAIGSSIGLAIGLNKLGKHVYIFNKSPLPEILNFLPRAGLISNKIPSTVFDVLCLVDCNSIERVGMRGFKAKNTLIIDHHIPSSNPLCNNLNSSRLIQFIDENASATGELVYKLLNSLSVRIDREIATNLYTAIYTDTGGFRYSNTNPESLIISSRLIEAGADPWEVTKEVYESMPLKRLKLLNLALETLEKKGAVAWMVINKRMFRKTKTSVQDTENFVDFPRKIRGVGAAVLFREEGKNVYKLSLRSKGGIDVEKIARDFGGGGHHNAAGCILSGSLPEIKKKVLHAFRKAARK
jgi:phosphoesterase RecJ-like protein